MKARLSTFKFPPLVPKAHLRIQHWTFLLSRKDWNLFAPVSASISAYLTEDLHRFVVAMVSKSKLCRSQMRL